ncbi:MAG: hypothetical protein EBQ85_00145 [Proteobacteria bacterium]|nr:hypothetical protein [Pseudomonadota bacterium]
MPAAVFSQLPGELTLQLVRGDEVSFSAVFTGSDLATYTLESHVYTGQRDTLTVLVTPTVTKSTATVAGVTSTTVQISMTETQTLAIPSYGTPRWYLRWVSAGGVTRTILAGAVKAENP